MRYIFLLLAAGGLAWMATLMATADAKIRKRLYRRLDAKRLADQLHNDSLQKALSDAGFSISAKRFNLFRLLIILTILVTELGSSFITGERSVWPLFMVFLIWFTTTPRPMTLGWFVYTKLKQRRERQKNRELIALIRLYEQNKRGQNLKLDVFLKRVANHFEFLGKELIALSERVTDDGLEDAIRWFTSLFPDHPFAGQIGTILLATEQLPSEEAVPYLEQESHTIARISSDLYAERWNTLSTLALIVNATPSFAMFFLVIALVLYHITSIQNLLF